MTHLKYEEIAKLVEGNAKGKDRQRFLNHISQCRDCSAVYSETARFMEEEGKIKSTLTFPILPKPDLQTFRQAVNEIFTGGKYRLAAAAIAVFLLLAVIPFVLENPVRSRIENPRLAHIEANITQLETLSFTPTRDEVYAAICTGMLLEDLSVLDNISHKAALKQKLVNLLNRQPGTSQPLNRRQLAELTRFGRFLERSALDTFENKLPKPQDIAAYERIAQKYHLPRGILIRLKKLEKAASAKEYRAVHEKITEIIFE
jgi:hypothetical protein